MLDLSHSLLAVAYTLILAATIPTIASSDVSWALVPLLLAVVGYSGSILKALAPDEKQAKKLAKVVWLAWVIYYSLAVIWPLPMHWYDSLVILSLLLMPDNMTGSALMAVYYLFSAAEYMHQQNALQVAGRVILTVLVTIEAAQQARRALQARAA